MHYSHIKLGISLSFIALLIYWLDWQQALNAITQANIAWLFIASLVILLVIFLDGLRLYWMTPVVNFKLSEHIRLALRSAFVIQFSFGAASGDVYRTTVYALKAGTVLKPALHIIAARLAGVTSMGIVAIGASLWILHLDYASNQELGVKIIKVVMIFFLSFALLIVALFLTIRKKGATIPNWVNTTVGALKSITPRIWGLSLIMVVIRGLSLTCVLFAVGQVTPLHVPFLASITATLSALLPLAFGGLGVKEGTLAGTIALFGIPFSIAMSTAILMRLVVLFACSIGLLLSLIITNREIPSNRR